MSCTIQMRGGTCALLFISLVPVGLFTTKIMMGKYHNLFFIFHRLYHATMQGKRSGGDVLHVLSTWATNVAQVFIYKFSYTSVVPKHKIQRFPLLQMFLNPTHLFAITILQLNLSLSVRVFTVCIYGIEILIWVKYEGGGGGGGDTPPKRGKKK